jgi:hypothetical protein
VIIYAELTLYFPGLLVSLIPGLEESNDTTTKMIFLAFEDFINKLRKELFMAHIGHYY